MCNREKWRNFVYYRKKYEKSTKYYVDNVDNLFAKELFTNIYNVSGAHSYQQVALCTIF